MNRLTISLHSSLQSWSSAWRDRWASLTPHCGYRGCLHARKSWSAMRRQPRGVYLQGVRYCRAECLEQALIELLGSSRSTPRRAAQASHRIPLGLLLLSRQQLTAEQLRAALEAQRAASHSDCQNSDRQSNDRRNNDRRNNESHNNEGRNNDGPNNDGEPIAGKKIGAWLQELGFATESQITAALARQWSCPVLRAPDMAIAASRFPAIPALLLESFQMIPVELVEATGTLLMAFSEGIDYTMLYAIEQMLGFHTEPCLMCPSSLQKSLQVLERQRAALDVVFDRTKDAGECARIIGSYCAKVRAEEVRVAWCGDHLWIRLQRLRQEAVTLVLRAPGSSQFSVLSSQ
jgi:hypothetical protein